MELLKDSLSQFLFQTSALEWLGVLTGIICVWLAARNNIYSWPIALVSVVVYMFIFFESKLYADMGLQVYFFFMNIYGWYYWSKAANHQKTSRPISSAGKKEMLFSAIGILVFTVILGQLLYKNTDAALPYLDSFCTACSLVAQIFLARKVIQNWLIWIFVDIIYVGMYLSKDLYATAIMYTLYVYIALVGYLEWRKIYREQAN